MKKILRMGLPLALFATGASAVTYPPSHKHSHEHDTYHAITEQSTLVTEQGLVAINFPETTENPDHARLVDVMFYYHPDVLDDLGGDHAKLVDYVEKSIDVNNEIFKKK